MSENTKATKKRKSFDKDIEPTNKAKMATFETPKQAKPASKIQSEQKQIGIKNKNKRKSLPANLMNGDGANSPKKTKIEPFPGTNDLFKEAGEKSKMKPKNVKGRNEKSKVKNESKNANNKSPSPSEKPLGKRAKQQRERYVTMRTSAKNKLKQTLIQAAAGEETAINYLKERVSQLSQKDQKALTSTAKRKIKMFKKTLKAGGVDISIFEKDSGKREIGKVEKENQKAKNQKQGKKELTKSMEKVNKPKSAKIIKQEKKPTSIKTKDDDNDEEDELEISVTEEEVRADLEEGDSEDGEESEQEESGEDEEAEEEESDEGEEVDLEENDSENSNSLIDMESVEEEDNEEEEEEDNAESEEDSDRDENDSDDEVSHKKAKISKKSPTESSENQTNETVSELTKNKSRYVLFVGNLPYNVTREDIGQHFAKIGKLKDVRIPLDKSTNKCKGFAYVELLDQTSYEKALSFHHTNLKGRRINVSYTQAGKKQGDQKKKEIKAKNFKLQAMRQGGKLSGSVKQSQKRATRRDKKRNFNKSN